MAKKLEIPPVVEIPVPDQEDNTYQQPEQDVPESEKTAKWYIENSLYIAKQYNIAPEGYYGGRYLDYDTATDNGSPGNNFGVLTGMAEEMILMQKYYLGEQPNLTYNYLTQDATGNNLQAPWVKGQEIAELVNHLKGTMETRLNSAEWTAKALSEDAQNAWEDAYDMVMMKYDFAPMFKELEEEFGLVFEPMNGKEIPTRENIPRWFEENFKEFGAETASYMAQAIWFTDYWKDKMKQAFTYATVCGAAAGEHDVVDGKPTFEVFPPYQAIIDRRHDDDFNRKAQFWGRVYLTTPVEIFKRWPELDKEEREEINKLATDQDYGSTFNEPFNNIVWWNYNQGNTQVAVAKVYWKGMRDVGVKKTYNTWGNERIIKTAEKEEGDYNIPDIYKATIIGNRYMVDVGLVDNIAEEFGNESNPLSPIQIFLPDMTLGRTRGFVSRLHVLQNEKDALEYKIKEMIGRAKGKVYVVRGDKLGNSVDAKEMLEDLSAMGVTVTYGTDGESLREDSGQIIESVDMTLDPSVGALMNIIVTIKETMKEVASVSKIALGQQQVFVGRQTQANSIARSTLGLMSLFNGFMNWVQCQMHYATNVAKILYTQKDNFHAPLVIGERGIKYVKMTKQFRFEQFLIMLQINNIIDEEQKEKLEQVALAGAQNGLIDLIDWVNVQKLPTYDQVENSLIARQKEREQKRAEQEAIAHQRAMEQIQAQNAGKQEAIGMEQQGQNQREMARNTTKLTEKEMELETREEQ